MRWVNLERWSPYLAALFLVAIVITSIVWVNQGSREEDEGPRLGALASISWEAETFDPPHSADELVDLQVDLGVDILHVKYSVQLPSVELEVARLLNRSLEPPPYFSLTLWEPDGTTVWEAFVNVTSSAAKIVPVEEAGTWTLRVSFRGYGTDDGTALGLTFDFRDSVSVTVSAH
jgi:hypothetical protein